MGRKPKSKPAAPEAAAAPAVMYSRPHVDVDALRDEIIRRRGADVPLLIYREGILIGAFLPIDAARWSGARDGQTVSYDLQSYAAHVGQDLARDWYAHNFDADLGEQAIALQVATSNLKYGITGSIVNTRKMHDLHKNRQR